MALLTICILCLRPDAPRAQDDFLPDQLSGVIMGMPQEEVLKRIGNAGSLTTIPFADGSRTKSTWSLPDHKYFKSIELRFSPKGRLFMMRFTLQDELRRDSGSLKKGFIDKFIGPTLDPRRFQVEGSDMILYLPVDRGKANFFDATDLKTGNKIFELFDGGVDAEDLQEARKAAEQAGGQKSGNDQGARDGVAPSPSGQRPSDAPTQPGK